MLNSLSESAYVKRSVEQRLLHIMLSIQVHLKKWVANPMKCHWKLNASEVLHIALVIVNWLITGLQMVGWIKLWNNFSVKVD